LSDSLISIAVANGEGREAGGSRYDELMKYSLALACVAVGLTGVSSGSPDAASIAKDVTLVRVPHGGIQPEAMVGDDGVLHLLYFSGEARGGNLFYVRSTGYGSTFATPVRVNSQDGSAIASGTIRGGQLALGRGGRVHVTWNGSDTALPRGLLNPDAGKTGAPFLYTRSNAGGTAFDAQRSLTLRSYGIDGGGSIAANRSGEVYAAWHGLATGGASGEDHRRVWISRSQDDGATFSAEEPAWTEPTGACGCCGLRLFAGRADSLYLLYRSATAMTHRDIYLLASNDRARTFHGSRVQEWNIGACPMSSMSFAAGGTRLLGAWETAGQVYFGEVDSQAARIPTPIGAPGEPGTRKHPRIAMNTRGQALLVWTEGTAWARGGSVAWQAFDESGRPSGPAGKASDVPAWSFATPVARPDGTFVVFY
jgi:hypothetical protein